MIPAQLAADIAVHDLQTLLDQLGDMATDPDTLAVLRAEELRLIESHGRLGNLIHHIGTRSET